MISSFISIINKNINNTLSLDPQKTILLSIIYQKSIRIIIRDLNISFYINANNYGIILSEENILPNSLCVLEGKYNNFIRMLLSHNPQRFIKDHTIQQKGDLNVLRSYQLFLKSTKLDIESFIEKTVGVIPSSILLFPIKKLYSLYNYKIKHITRNTPDFLIEEAQYLIGQEELHDYFDDIYGLKSDFDRVSAKVNLYQDYLIKSHNEKN